MYDGIAVYNCNYGYTRLNQSEEYRLTCNGTHWLGTQMICNGWYRFKNLKKNVTVIVKTNDKEVTAGL